jgi:hypothetical protein
MNGKKLYWVRCDGKGKPIGSRRYIWGSIFRRYSHGLDPNIIEVNDHPLVAFTTIWDIMAKSWRYIDYPLSNKAFKIYLKTILNNKRHSLKVWIESRKKRPKTCTPTHWENMKAMIHDLFKVEEATRLKVSRRCEQNPSCLGHVEDEIQTRFARFVSCLGVIMCL